MFKLTAGNLGREGGHSGHRGEEQGGAVHGGPRHTRTDLQPRGQPHHHSTQVQPHHHHSTQVQPHHHSPQVHPKRKRLLISREEKIVVNS